MAKTKGTGTRGTRTTLAHKSRTPPGAIPQEDLARLTHLVHQKLEAVPASDLDGPVELRFTSDELRGFEKIDSYFIFRMCHDIAKENPRFANVSIVGLFEKPNEAEWMADNSSRMLPSVRKAVSRLVGQTDKSSNRAGQVSEPLAAYLMEMNVPRKKWREAALELARTILRFGAPEDRPLWDDRAKYPELANLSAPLFLKQVWADQIGPDGMIEKESVRQKDPKLMSNVDKYVAKREEREQDAGDAEGLRFRRSRVGRPKGFRGP